MSRRPGVRWSAVLAVVVGATTSVPSPTAQSPEPSDRPPRIARIRIIRHDVFEPPARGWATPYRLANRLHVETRESVVRRELLFAQGELADAERLAQTERNLRALVFLRDARVRSTPVEGGVDVVVETWDTWSLTPRVQFAHTDDRTVWSVGLSETNLAGWGKEVSVRHQVTLDRTANRAWYRDPQLFDSRLRLTVAGATLSDGDELLASLDRPFYSLDDRWGWLAGASSFTRTAPIFEEGVEVERLPHVGRAGDLLLARRVTGDRQRAVRVHAAGRLRDDTVAGARRRFHILEGGLSAVTHRFVRLTHVNRFERPEDINLGPQSSVSLGVSGPWTGGAGGRVLFVGASQTGALVLAPTHFLAASAGLTARHEPDGWTNVLGQVRWQYLRQHATRHTLLGKMDLRLGHDLDPEVQLLLGAASGLRGYPVRRFHGTRSLLLSAEERWFAFDDVAQLLSLGLAAFVDSGYAWPDGQAMRLSDLRTAIGGSLLLGSNRFSASPGVRLNLAYALDPLPETDRWVFTAVSHIGF